MIGVVNPYTKIGLPVGALSDHVMVLANVTKGNEVYKVETWNILRR